ncbi:uncharacterized protein [Onthophagus taurus]|uniref:uncharacterized protein n=1 Tax=Onthophagus taurus TaxID=166361 RepID=UPI0039BDD72F
MEIDPIIVSTLLIEDEENEIPQREKRIWVHSINLKRQWFGEYYSLYPDLLKDDKRFFKYFHMTPLKFRQLLGMLEPHITRQNTRYRMAIGPEERLVVCLRFLTTGNSFTSLADNYRLGETTVREIVYSTCEAIWAFIQPIVMPTPNENLWLSSEAQFRERWNFPNAVGALDGKHILIEAPQHSGSNYFCYKKHFSIVLLALVDANKKFIAVDVGAFGKNSDARIFQNSNMGQSLREGNFNMPPPKPLPDGNNLPHVIVGDEAFPLCTYLMRPYSRDDVKGNEEKKIFNYRLSRARNTVENAFGLLVRKFRLFEHKLHMSRDHTVTIILAICALHNFLREDICYWSKNDHVRLSDMRGIKNMRGARGNIRTTALAVRNTFKDYFCSEVGSVEWQRRRVREGKLH